MTGKDTKKVTAEKRQKLVVDSSVIVKWLSSQDEDHLEQVDRLLKDVQNGKIELYTCELVKYEVANALLKGKGLDLSQAEAVLATFYNLPLTYLSETKERAKLSYALGQKLKITYYDAVFISLAKELKASLITDNPKHQAKPSSIIVIQLKDY